VVGLPCTATRAKSSTGYGSVCTQDLRKMILEAVDRGMLRSEAAKTFGVSRSSVKRYAAACREEGRPLAPRDHPGSNPKLDESTRELLEANVEVAPLTLKDRCRFLEEMVGVSVSESTLRVGS
jgi:transposase